MLRAEKVHTIHKIQETFEQIQKFPVLYAKHFLYDMAQHIFKFGSFVTLTYHKYNPLVK